MSIFLQFCFDFVIHYPWNFRRECLSARHQTNHSIHHTPAVNLCSLSVNADRIDFYCFQKEYKNPYLTLGRIVNVGTHHTSKSLYAVISVWVRLPPNEDTSLSSTVSLFTALVTTPATTTLHEPIQRCAGTELLRWAFALIYFILCKISINLWCPHCVFSRDII